MADRPQLTFFMWPGLLIQTPVFLPALGTCQANWVVASPECHPYQPESRDLRYLKVVYYNIINQRPLPVQVCVEGILENLALLSLCEGELRLQKLRILYIGIVKISNW